ncbi:DUF4132 domain-containing protein [Actinoplanes sp. NPDC051861]|uniref:DUF4132 domain-containing protein n=1 Tax=Actinoplanes sp. NPDC051861 TaxID=3155170 RepID=UPI0034463202
MSFVLPEPWSSQLHPRRGGAGARPVTPDPRAREVVDGLLRAIPGFVPGVIFSEFTDPAVREAAIAWWGRDPAAPPAGAAAVALAAQLMDWQTTVNHPWSADLWLAERGVLFAAEAAVELFSLALVAEGNRELHRAIRRDGTETVGVRHRRLGETRGMAPFFDPALLVLLRVRAALATVTDDVHADVVAALATYRDAGVYQRCATSLLAPSERDWVAHDWTEALTEPDSGRASRLLAAIGTPEQAEAARAAGGSLAVDWPGLSATVVDGVGPAAATGLLLDWMDRVPATRADRRRELLSLITVLPEDAAMRGLIERLSHRHVRPALIEMAERFPARGLRLLATSAERPGVSDLLRARVLADTSLAAQVLPELDGAAAARIREILDLGTTLTFAPTEALPPLLVDPPWRRRRKPVPPPVIPLTPLPVPVAVEWAEGEREAWDAVGFSPYGAGDWTRAAERLRHGEPKGARESVEFFVGAPEDLAGPLLAGWQPGTSWDCGRWMRRIAARFGADALPPLLTLAPRAPAEVAELLQPFTAPEIPVLMAEWLGRLKRARAAALAWFDRHPAAAARVLVPRALGPAGASRQQAEAALLALVTAGHGEALSEAAKEYGPAAAAVIETLAATDPLEILPARVPALPEWVDPGLLPPVRLRGGGVLPPDAIRDLAMVFALGRPGEPYPGVDVVRAAFEPADLARFGWGLFEGWLADGAEGKHGWVLDVLGLVGDDETVRRLTPRILAWPGEGGSARAVTGVRVLAEIGTDVALMQLSGIAERSKFKTLKAAARETVTEVAAGLGLTAEQLADRLVPDFGLSVDGALTLDYGRRSFVVSFDEQLRPFVTDAAGKRLKALPKPGVQDDPVLASAAHQRFAALKKEVRSVAGDQIRRLERAMVTGRRWTPAEFERFFMTQPLVRNLSRRLLWGRFDTAGALVGAMRVAEDGTLADVDDETVSLPGGAVVGLVHPLHLGEDRHAWSEVFADYQILQPFPQLGRETAALTEAEASGSELTRVRDRVVPASAVLGLEGRGWRRESPQDGGVQGRVSTTPVDGVEISLGLDPGIVVGEPDFFPEQRLDVVTLHGTTRTFGELDPVVASELLRDLNRLVG